MQDTELPSSGVHDSEKQSSSHATDSPHHQSISEDGAEKSQLETDGTTNESDRGSEDLSKPGAKAGLTVTQFWIALLGLNLGMFLTALDFNIVATAVPVISSEFQEYSNSSFIGTAFLITFGTFMPIYAKLGDMFGRNNMFTFATVIFVLGSGLCAGSKSMSMLIWSRAIQGIGGGGIYGLVNVIITDLVPLRDVGKYLSATIAIWAIADVVGPLLGGIFTVAVTWRWCFWINLILSPISLIVTVLSLKRTLPSGSIKERIKNFDYLGAVLMLGGFISILISISWGGNSLPWSDQRVIGMLVGGVVMVILFGVWENFAKDPLVPFSLLKTPTIVLLCTSEFFMGMNILGMMYYVPQFFQLVFADSPIIAGVGLLPMMLGLGIGNPIAGFLTSKYGISRANAVAGNALMTLFTGLATRWNAHTSRAEVYVELIFLGMGQGASMSGLLLTGQVAVQPALIGIVTGLIILFLILGNAFGISFFSAVYINELRSRLQQLRLPSAQISEVLLDIQVLKNYPAALRDSIVVAYAESMKNGWWVMFAAAAVALIAVMFARQHKFD